MLSLATVLPMTSLLPQYPLSNFLKPCSSSTAGKRTGEKPNLSRISPIPKLRLAACLISAAETGNDEGSSAIPKHVAFIIDGHRKWAKCRGRIVQDGHKNGAVNLKNLASHSSNLGIKILTIYAFSTETWNRSKMEVDFMLTLLEEFVRSDVKELIDRLDIRFSVIGNKSRLPETLESAISSAEEVSKGGKGMHLVVAISYGGRNDIVEAAKKITTKVKHGILEESEIDESVLEQHLMTNVVDSPNPDLWIRAGGELRLSNFFLWQLAYTELYFADALFPDFGEAHLRQALASYHCRKRRFGLRDDNSY